MEEDDIRKYVRENPYDGDFDGYLSNLFRIVDKKYEELMAGSYSPEFRVKMVKAMVNARELLRLHALAEKELWRLKEKDDVPRMGEGVKLFYSAMDGCQYFYDENEKVYMQVARVDSFSELPGDVKAQIIALKKESEQNLALPSGDE